MDSAKRSLTARRSAFTRHHNACDTFISDIESLDSSVLDISMVDGIEALFLKAENAYDNLQECLNTHSDTLDSESIAKQETLLNEFCGNLSKLRERILTTSSKIRAQVDLSSLVLVPASPTVPSFSKINVALKPEKLMSSCTLAEFRSWSTGFSLFYSSNHMENFPVAEQHGYLRSCLELKLQQMLATKIHEDTPVLGDSGCIEKLREIFVQHIPILTRRYNFFRCNQQTGERFSDWYLRLQLEGQEAELSSLGVDDLYILRLVTGTSDRRLREEFLRQAEPSRDLLHRTAMAWESANSVEAVFSSNSPVATIAATSSYKSNSKMDTSSVKDELQDTTAFDPASLHGKCYGCGRASHPGGSSREHCPARGQICHSCQKEGHFASVCTRGRLWRGRTKSAAHSGSTRYSHPVRSAAIHVSSVHARPPNPATFDQQPQDDNISTFSPWDR